MPEAQEFVADVGEASIERAREIAKEQLPKVRQSMLETEALLRNRCGLGVALDYAQESCFGAACGAISAQLNRPAPPK